MRFLYRHRLLALHCTYIPFHSSANGYSDMNRLCYHISDSPGIHGYWSDTRWYLEWEINRHLESFFKCEHTFQMIFPVLCKNFLVQWIFKGFLYFVKSWFWFRKIFLLKCVCKCHYVSDFLHGTILMKCNFNIIFMWEENFW